MLGGEAIDSADINWKELLDEGDNNGDGEISFDEFKVMMKKFIIKQ
jgi:Ca2+-binding EF-hand superfamily protein